MQEKQPQTIVINNLTGSLTRALNGDLNSGLAKFYSSWGYNPFTKPGNLTWNLSPASVSLDSIHVDELILDGKVRVEGNSQYIYMISDRGDLIKMLGDGSGGPTLLHSLSSGTPTFNYGASLYFFNGKIWITNDKGVSRIDFDGTNETVVGTWDSSHFIQSTYHPLVEFQGRLLVGNTTDGTSTNFGTIDTTNLITNYNTVTPSLPIGTYIRDMDITSDFSYLTISASSIAQEQLTPGDDITNSYSGDSFVFRWNGSDPGITSGISLPNFGITALNNFGQSEYSFMYDSLGAGLYDGGFKRLTLVNNKSPLPNATAATGNLISWAAPEVATQLDPVGQTSTNAIYFYGQLDEESPKGLWRMLRQDLGVVNGSVSEIPFMAFTTNQYVFVQATGALTQVFPLQLFSRQEFNTSGTPSNELYLFTYGAGPGSNVNILKGVYETQTQLFSKRMNISQIRVYVEPTVVNNGFQLEMIDVDGTTIDGGLFTYTYGDILDPQTNAKSVERINFNPNTKTIYGLGIRLTNTDENNMTFKKIEIDISEAGQ